MLLLLLLLRRRRGATKVCRWFLRRGVHAIAPPVLLQLLFQILPLLHVPAVVVVVVVVVLIVLVVVIVLVVLIVLIVLVVQERSPRGREAVGGTVRRLPRIADHAHAQRHPQHAALGRRVPEQRLARQGLPAAAHLVPPLQQPLRVPGTVAGRRDGGHLSQASLHEEEGPYLGGQAPQQQVLVAPSLQAQPVALAGVARRPPGRGRPRGRWRGGQARREGAARGVGEG
mmetsp:Transcript_40747/g.79395  ORF Transcript_40747/g.79395 Transcript_40747/m.79395 type:complete len:228 (-) Transcript_40747:1111-1794(-)